MIGHLDESRRSRRVDEKESATQRLKASCINEGEHCDPRAGLIICRVDAVGSQRGFCPSDAIASIENECAGFALQAVLT